MNSTIQEGKVELFIVTGKISKKLPVFYNPEMAVNRDVSVLLVQQFPDRRVCDLLSGSGARAVRLAKETTCKSIAANDYSKTAVALIKKNAKHNKIKLIITNKEANILLRESEGFDYIDIDPFGSPNHFLESSIHRLSRKGILAVTATDTAPLCGTYLNACKRKYWALPLRNELMHEVGIRILIRKVQLVAATYNKALQPLLVHATKHYMRVYFMNNGGKTEVDTLIAQHQWLLYETKTMKQKISRVAIEKKGWQSAGPLWTGPLWDYKLVKKMLKNAKEGTETYELLSVIAEESKIKKPFYYDIHKLCKLYKKTTKKMETIFETLKKKGYNISRTHFNRHAIKTDAPLKIVKKIF